MSLHLLVAGCVVGDPQPAPDFRACSEVDLSALGDLEPLLSYTGLYNDIAADVIARDVVAYTPQFELWSGGASKRRWMRLPRGARIDTSDADAWQFPVGTRFWKEFTSNGVRVETRMLVRTGAGEDDWVAVAYVWDRDGGDARIAPGGMVHALGTLHDVPAASACMACHRGTQSRVLGFSAVQLSPAGSGSEIDLPGLIGRDLLTAVPRGRVAVPGDSVARRAVGWLHANCGHCHNQARPRRLGPRCYDPQRGFDLSLRVEDLDSLEATGVYRTAIGTVIEPGAPDDSAIVQRIRGGDMPPLAAGALDEAGVAAVREWIRGL